jgi:hypothetical protein
MTSEMKAIIAKLKRHDESFKAFIMPPPYRMKLEEVQAMVKYFASLNK